MKFSKNLTFFYLSSFFVLSLFSYLFYISTIYTINFWTFSQSHLNYSGGFVKRGLFGTISIFFENNFSINTSATFSYFFIFLYLVTILLYLHIIKEYISNKILFVYLLLSPTLIMFSFNDLGGYQRFDILSIFLILFHSLLVRNYRKKIINYQIYLKIFNYFILPFIIISLFIHEIQAWTVPFHFLLAKLIIGKNKSYLKILFPSFAICSMVILFIFFYPVSQNTIDIMLKQISLLTEKDLWLDAVLVAAKTEGNLGVIKYELNTNLFNFYNFKINIFFIALSILPFHFFIKYFKNNKTINDQNQNTLKYLYLSILPLFLFLFPIGDTGRWINIISFISFAFFAQYPFKNILKDNFFPNFNIKTFPLILIVIICCFFIRLPHCCNLEAKEINIWGGLSKKFLVFYYMQDKKYKDSNYDVKEKYYNIKERFKKAK